MTNPALTCHIYLDMSDYKEHLEIVSSCVNAEQPLEKILMNFGQSKYLY